LKWEPQEIVNDGDVYVVRSIATGTPNGDFMGVPTDGTKVSTHHIEDWGTAMKQLK